MQQLYSIWHAIIYEPIIITNEITDVLCFGEDNGTYLQISGGTSPYIEDWNGQILPNSQLVITIQWMQQLYIFGLYYHQSDLISVEELVTDANCFNSNDGHYLKYLKGTSPYNEDWELRTLFFRIYSYTITDNNSCSYTDSVLISQSNQYMNFSLESPICIYDSSKFLLM